ncbi:beta-L-arabinofuranosidase domain-containing protein [Nonomuraea antimicrobica]
MPCSTRSGSGATSPRREPLRGWYGEGLFNNLGQFFTLYARIYAATGDERFATKARELLDGWAETIDENGYFFNATWAGAKEYSYDKLVCGLLDLHEYVGHGDALPILRRISEWMWRYGDRSRRYAWNGMGPLEWYTLPEYLLRAYTVTGDPLYRELADVYFYDEFYDALLDADNLMSRADQVHRFYQAHSHLNTLNSAAARYEVTGSANSSTSSWLGTTSCAAPRRTRPECSGRSNPSSNRGNSPRSCTRSAGTPRSPARHGP